MKPTSILARTSVIFVLGAVLFSCTHLRQPPPARPTILLLDDADKEWSRLPSEVRESFKKHVDIKRTTVDQIVQNPEILEFVIGFLCSDLTSFDPIRYLSFDSVHQVEAEASLHLFRRRTFSLYPEDQLRGFFLYLSSLSDQIGWGSTPSREEMFQKEFHQRRLEYILENTLIGDFKPSSNGPFIFLEEVEILTRKAGIDFEHPIFVIPDEFHDHIKNYGVRPYPRESGVSPDWSIMELLEDHSGTLGFYFHIHDGVFNLMSRHSQMPKTQVYRINPRQLARWIEWAIAKESIQSSVEFRKLEWLEGRAFRISDDEDLYPPFIEEDPFGPFQKTTFAPQSLTREKIEYYLSRPRETLCAEDCCNPEISRTGGSLDPFSATHRSKADLLLQDALLTPFRHITWTAPDQLHVKLYLHEFSYAERFLYLLQTGAPDR